MFTEDGPSHPVIEEALQTIMLTKTFLETVAKSDEIDESIMGTPNPQREAVYLIHTSLQKIVDFYESLT